ncbi:hypothetical protein EMIT0P74_500001 [Pseudomonas sp. IT-P74]
MPVAIGSPCCCVTSQGFLAPLRMQVADPMKSDSADYWGFSNPTLRLSGAVLLTNTFGTRLLQSSAASRLDGPLNTARALVFKARLGQLHFEGRNKSSGTPLSVEQELKNLQKLSRRPSNVLF